MLNCRSSGETICELLEGEVRDIEAMHGVGASNEEEVEIIKEEIRKVISRLKRGKASRVCGIQGEVLKATGQTAVEWLEAIFNEVWETGIALKTGKGQLSYQSIRKEAERCVETTEGSVC